MPCCGFVATTVRKSVPRATGMRRLRVLGGGPALRAGPVRARCSLFLLGLTTLVLGSVAAAGPVWAASAPDTTHALRSAAARPTVDDGATLAGGDTLGTVEVKTGVVLEPGGSARAGMLDAGRDLRLDNDSELDFNLSQGAASDLAAVVGALKAERGFVLHSSDASSVPQPGAIYTLATFASASGLSASDVSYDYTGAYSGFSGHFLLASTSLRFVMGNSSQTITDFMATPANSVYSSGGSFTMSATPGASKNPVVFAIDASSTSVCSISVATVSILTAGTCTVTANEDGDATYAAAPELTLPVSIAKASQDITDFTAVPANPAYVHNGTFDVSATGGGSGSSVIFGSSTVGVCTVSGSTVTMLAPDNCSLTANQAGDGNYEAAVQSNLDVALTAPDLNVTISHSPQFIAYNGMVTYTITVGNAGNGAAVDAQISDVLPSDLTLANPSWGCVAAGGAQCTTNGSGPLNDTFSIPAAGSSASVTYLLNAWVNPTTSTGTISNTVTVSVSGDTNMGNNSVTDNATVVIFRDGFELPDS